MSLRLTKAAEAFGEFRDWAYPPRGASAEFKSVEYQARQRTISPTPENLKEKCKLLVARYPKSKPPSWAGSKIDNELLAREVKFHMERNTVMDSTPGMPYKLLGPTNEKVLEKFSTHIGQLVLARIHQLSKFNLHELKQLTAFGLCERGLCDPVRVFVKNEPHSKVKMSQGRYRIIASVSLVDSLVQRCLLQAQDELEIEMWTTHPSQPGLGFTRSMTKQFLKQIPEGDVAEADVTGWDWSVQGWEFEAEAFMRVLLVDSCPPLFARLLQNLLYVQSMSVISLSNGEMYQQLSPGIMKSGSKNTSSSNSRIRALAHYLLTDGDPWVLAMGDDSLERWFPDAMAKYHALGHPIKTFAKSGDVFEFCGHLYDRTTQTCRPVNVVKMMVRYCALPSPSAEQRGCLFMELENALPSEMDWVFAVFRHLGEEVPNAD